MVQSSISGPTNAFSIPRVMVQKPWYVEGCAARGALWVGVSEVDYDYCFEWKSSAQHSAPADCSIVCHELVINADLESVPHQTRTLCIALIITRNESTGRAYSKMWALLAQGRISTWRSLVALGCHALCAGRNNYWR
jgi:hypothetical protein